MIRIRFALLAAALVLIAPLAQAQFIPKFGVTGGPNFGSLNDAGGYGLENSTGYHVGVFGDLGFGSFATRAAILYVKIGESNRELPPSDCGPIVPCGPMQPSSVPGPDVAFIAVPIDLRYRFLTPVVKPYALLGPEARFPTGDLADADARSVNLAINAGVGAELDALVGPSVFAELRYAFDVTGFADDEFFGVPTDESFNVSVFYVRVGVGL